MNPKFLTDYNESFAIVNSILGEVMVEHGKIIYDKALYGNQTAYVSLSAIEMGVITLQTV